jgi:hypothetical protein
VISNRLSATLVALGFVLASSSASTNALAQGLPPTGDASPQKQDATPQRQLVYSILRNGSPIGEYKIAITTDGHSQIVTFSTEIKVTVLMLTAYHLSHSGREVWTDGKFASYKGVTDDNGTRHVVSLTNSATGAALVVDGRRERAPKGTLPATFWNAKSLQATTVIDPDDGKIIPIVVNDIGNAMLQVNGASELAHHFHIDGIDRDIWMVKGSPVKIQLKGSDNSTITSQLQEASS